MSEFKSALIGCGMIGSRFADDPKIKGVYSHAGAYEACTGVTLSAVCDNDEQALMNCARRWDIKNTYRDITELLTKEKPEIVSICTPDASHAEVAREVLNSQSVRGVLLEKPLALDIYEARDLVKLAKDRNVVLAVNYSRRYSVGHERVKQLIERGTIGKVQAVSGYYTKGVLHNGTHWFDLARYLVGEVSSVSGFSSQRSVNKDPNLDVQLTFDSGCRGFLHGGPIGSYDIFEMDILATKGRVRIVDSGHRIEQYSVVDSAFYSGYKSLSLDECWDGELSDSTQYAVEDLVASTVKGGVPRCTGRDGMAALRIALAAIESWKGGVRVDIA